jgi:hypothetical protein
VHKTWFRFFLSMPFCRNSVTVALFNMPAGDPASENGANNKNGYELATMASPTTGLFSIPRTHVCT